MHIFIYIKWHIVYKYVYIYIIYIVIYIIYIHDDVAVSAYEYVNVYADDNGYVYSYLCIHELENEN